MGRVISDAAGDKHIPIRCGRTSSACSSRLTRSTATNHSTSSTAIVRSSALSIIKKRGAPRPRGTHVLPPHIVPVVGGHNDVLDATLTVAKCGAYADLAHRIEAHNLPPLLPFHATPNDLPPSTTDVSVVVAREVPTVGGLDTMLTVAKRVA